MLMEPIMDKFIWSHDHTRKVRLSTVKEFIYGDTLKVIAVLGNRNLMVVYEGQSKADCKSWIDHMTRGNHE